MLCGNREGVYKLLHFLLGEERRDFLPEKREGSRHFKSHREGSYFFFGETGHNGRRYAHLVFTSFYKLSLDSFVYLNRNVL